MSPPQEPCALGKVLIVHISEKFAWIGFCLAAADGLQTAWKGSVMNRVVAAFSVVVLSIAIPAGAAPIFYDDFESNNPGNLGLNKTPIGWTVADGTVDVLVFPSCVGSPSGGVCIDLDGSTGDAGRLLQGIGLVAGSYTWDFYLSGSDRGGSEIVDFFLNGSLIGSSGPLVSAAPWTPFSLPFVASVDGSYTIEFRNQGGDNVGAWLDDVSVSSVAGPSVPEPTSLLLFGTAVAAQVVSTRRRKRRPAR